MEIQLLAKRGVYAVEPQFPYGNFKDVAKGKLHMVEYFQNIYTIIKKKGLKYGGVYQGFQPAFLPVDQPLIKQILLKDFQHFVDHGTYCNPKADPLTGGLFQLEGEAWRNHRAKLTPTFTSGKMRMMFKTLVEKAKGLEELLKSEASTGEPIFIKEMLARYGTDVIGSVAFGIDCNCLNTKTNEFREQCDKSFDIQGKFRKLAFRNLPFSVLKAINYKLNEPEVIQFFFNLVENTINYREKNNVSRNDFLQMLIELKNTGTVSEGETLNKTMVVNTTNPYFTLDEIVAHSFTFFLAGFETSSTTLSFVLAELGLHQEIQERVREEILDVLAKHNGEVTYEALSEMTYVEQVILESMRKYPPIPIIPRMCTKDYPIPGEDFVLKKGTLVQIPVHAIQNDPEIFADPKKFDPDRWAPGNNIDKFQFLAFGEGPRQCIGMRFGKVQVKMGLITLLKNFRLKLNKKTKVPIKFSPTFIINVDGGVWLDLEELNKK